MNDKDQLRPEEGISYKRILMKDLWEATEIQKLRYISNMAQKQRHHKGQISRKLIINCRINLGLWGWKKVNYQFILSFEIKEICTRLFENFEDLNSTSNLS